MDNYTGYYANVSIDGTPLDEQRIRSIQSISINNPIDGSTSCTLTVFDTEKVYIEDNIFIEDVRINVTMGMWDIANSQQKFEGYISFIDIDFGSDGVPVLSILCMDETHMMNRLKKKRTWTDSTSVKVVTLIASEYGLKVITSSSYAFAKEKTIVQSEVTDIKFIEMLGEKERDTFKVKLEGDTLYYIPMEFNASPVDVYAYGEFPYDVVRFKPSINKETIQVDSEASDILTETKKNEERTATQEDTARDTTQGDWVEPLPSPMSGFRYNEIQGGFTKGVK